MGKSKNKSFLNLYISPTLVGLIFAALTYLSIERYQYNLDWKWIIPISILGIMIEKYGEIQYVTSSNTCRTFGDVIFVWGLFVLNPMGIAIVSIFSYFFCDCISKASVRILYLDVVTPAIRAWVVAFAVQAPFQDISPWIILLVIGSFIVSNVVEGVVFLLFGELQEVRSMLTDKADYITKGIGVIFGIPAGLFSAQQPWAITFIAGGFIISVYLYKKYEYLVREKENLNILADTLDFTVEDLAYEEIEKELVKMTKRLINTKEVYIRNEEPQNNKLTIQLITPDGQTKWLVVESKDALNRHWRHPDYLRNLAVVESMAKRAFESLALRDQLTDAAERDALTGLYSRRTFESILNGELENFKRNNSNITLLFLDLDKFKPINDIHGHQSGDLVLKEIAMRLNTVVRSHDVIARIGGDEFIVMCRNTSFEESILLSERIEIAISEPIFLKKSSAKNEFVSVGVSIGIAQCDEAHDTSEKLINAADSAMYKQKNKHNNKDYQIFSLDIQKEQSA